MKDCIFLKWNFACLTVGQTFTWNTNLSYCRYGYSWWRSQLEYQKFMKNIIVIANYFTSLWERFKLISCCNPKFYPTLISKLAMWSAYPLCSVYSNTTPYFPDSLPKPSMFLLTQNQWNFGDFALFCQTNKVSVIWDTAHLTSLPLWALHHGLINQDEFFKFGTQVACCILLDISSVFL